jgi:phage baseplate assembly protein W
MEDITFRIEINGKPASDELMGYISEIQVEDNGTMPDIFRIFINIEKTEVDDWAFISDKNFEPFKLFRIYIKIGQIEECLIDGYVTDHKIHFSENPNDSYLELIGMDQTYLLDLDHKIEDFTQYSDSNIARHIFEDCHGIPSKVDSTPKPSYNPYKRKIQNGTDLQFLRELAKLNGFVCYIESGEGYFKKPTFQGEPQKDLAINFLNETNVTSFDIISTRLKPTKTSIKKFDSKGNPIDLGSNPYIILYNKDKENVHDFAKSHEISELSINLNPNKNLQLLKDPIVDNSNWLIVAVGELDVGVYQSVLRSKKPVRLKGAGYHYSGKYYVSRVLHKLIPEKYTQRFELKRVFLDPKESKPFGAHAYPFSMGYIEDKTISCNDSCIRELIWQLLFTNPGERLDFPEFGCGLQKLIFAPNNEMLTTTTQMEITTALQKWLGHLIEVENVEVKSEDEKLYVQITYIMSETKERCDVNFIK